MDNMKDAVDRLRYLRKQELKLTQAKFAEKLGLSNTSYSNIEARRRSLSDKHARLICMTYHVNYLWLMTGEGDMFDHSEEIRQICELYLQLTPTSQKLMMDLARQLAEQSIDERVPL